MSKQLDEAILDHGVQVTNFFNGRLLTADDLKADQSANRQQHQQLGIAIGSGIVQGLEVKLLSPGSIGSLPVVSVSNGIALNRKGQILFLPDDQQLTLTRKVDLAAPEAGLFVDCTAAVSTTTNLPDGIYVLVIGPTSGYKDRAPLKALNAGDLAAGCGSKYAVEGVKFRLAMFDEAGFTGISQATRAQLEALLTQNDPISLCKLRNILAHAFFGTEELTGPPLDPFKLGGSASFYADYGAIDFMVSAGAIGACEVPLALVYWTGGLVEFLDMWTARRRAYTAARLPLSHFAAQRRAAEAEAMFFQYQDQLQALVAQQANPGLLVATDCFRYLPPAGLAPLRTGAFTAGIISSKFFQGKNYGPPTAIAGDHLRALIAESFDHGPIDLTSTDRLQLYSVKDNTQAQGAGGPQAYVVFASRFITYRSTEPRFPTLCSTLLDCRFAYQSLIQKSVFLANDIGPTALNPRQQVTAAIEQVASAADNRSVAACRTAPGLHLEAALGLLAGLYQVQRELVDVFNQPFSTLVDIPSIRREFLSSGFSIPLSGDPKLKEFAKILLTYLDVAIPAGKSSLKAAIAAPDLTAAIAAQDAINQLVGSWTGQATAGNVAVQYQSSNRGRTLVVGDTKPFNYTYRITNGTNKPLEVELAAEFLTPHPEWSSQITIQDTSGNPIEAVPLQPFSANNPNDSNTFEDVVVSVITPAAAKVGDGAPLRLRASVPPPIGVASSDQIDIVAGTSEVPESPNQIKFSTDSPILSGQLNQGKVAVPMTLRFDATFHAAQAPFTRQFRFQVVVTAPQNAASFYFISYTDKQPSTGGNPLPQGAVLERSTQPFALTSDVPTSTTVRVLPLSASGGALVFTVNLQATDDATLAVTAGPFTITATA